MITFGNTDTYFGSFEVRPFKYGDWRDQCTNTEDYFDLFFPENAQLSKDGVHTPSQLTMSENVTGFSQKVFKIERISKQEQLKIQKRRESSESITSFRT